MMFQFSDASSVDLIPTTKIERICHGGRVRQDPIVGKKIETALMERKSLDAPLQQNKCRMHSTNSMFALFYTKVNTGVLSLAIGNTEIILF